MFLKSDELLVRDKSGGNVNNSLHLRIRLIYTHVLVQSLNALLKTGLVGTDLVTKLAFLAVRGLRQFNFLFEHTDPRSGLLAVV